MAVTELARLRLQDGTEASSASLHANLAKAKNVMEKASGYEFWYYHCVEEPNVIFILGSWPSVDFHMHEFIPGAQNQGLLALLKDQVTVEWMFHLDIDQRTRPLPLNNDVLSIGRYIVEDGDKERFTATLDGSKHALESYVGDPDRFVWGWRLDKGYDPSINDERPKEQVVLFTGWDSVEQHLGFTNMGEFQKRRQTRSGKEESSDIKHARLMRVGEMRQ